MDIFAFVLLSIAMTFSPGPNNIMVLSSGVNYGFRKTLPHIWGIALGYPFMIFMTSLGIGALIYSYPVISTVLQWAGGMYMMYLAWQIANAQPMNSKSSQNEKENITNENTSKPLSFLQAVLFQWVNPKAWVMILNILSIYLNPAESYLFQMSVIVSISIFFTFAAVAMWTLFGTLLKQFLSNSTYNRVFNIIMALLLVISFILAMV